MALSPTAADADLVPLAREGRADAFGELVSRHRQAAFLFALQLLRNRDDALDVTQDALLRFMSTLGRFDARRPVRPWLFRIVRNCARDLQRRQKVRQAEPLERSEPDEAPLEIADEAPSPEARTSQRELQTAIWQALRAISEPHREILVLRDYQDLAYAEIADTLGIPIGTVMSRLHAARKALRSALPADLGGGGGRARGK